MTVLWSDQYDPEDVIFGWHEQEEELVRLADDWQDESVGMDDADAWLAAQDVPDWTV